MNLKQKTSASWLGDDGGLGQLVLGRLGSHVITERMSRNTCRDWGKDISSLSSSVLFSPALSSSPFHASLSFFFIPAHSSLLFLHLLFTSLSFRYFTHLSLRTERFADGSRLYSTSFLATFVSAYTSVLRINRLEKYMYYTNYIPRLEKYESRTFLRWQRESVISVFNK